MFEAVSRDVEKRKREINKEEEKKKEERCEKNKIKQEEERKNGSSTGDFTNNRALKDSALASKDALKYSNKSCFIFVILNSFVFICFIVVDQWSQGKMCLYTFSRFLRGVHRQTCFLIHRLIQSISLHLNLKTLIDRISRVF